MSARVLLPDAVVLPGGLVRDTAVLVEAGQIVRVGSLAALGGAHPVERIEGSLLPGLVDLQVNGGYGRGVDEATEEALTATAASVLEGGATSFLATLISAPFDALLDQVDAVARWIESGPRGGARPLGLHVEGPFLEVPAAHPAETLIDPTPARVDALIEAARGHLRLVTLAPGRAGAVQATARLVEAGACVSLGHAADPTHLAACVDAGASLVTHLFNAMSPIHHRIPSIALAALNEPRLTCCLISDGHHVRAEAMRLAWRVLGPERLLLVTDQAAPAGAPDGTYHLGPSQVTSSGGVVRDSEGRLAGSAALARDIVRGFRAAVPDITLSDLATITSLAPARAIGLDHGIQAGAAAEFSVMEDSGALRALIV